jgi:hypothetical protein
MKSNEKPPKVWVNPNAVLKGPNGNRSWTDHTLIPPTTARLLELADIALGLKTSPAAPRKKKKAAAA